METTHLLYLHGFRSSPSSAKAQKMARIMACRYPGVTWYCPQLQPSPAQAMAQLMRHITAWPNEASFKSMAVVGSLKWTPSSRQFFNQFKLPSISTAAGRRCPGFDFAFFSSF